MSVLSTLKRIKKIQTVTKYCRSWNEVSVLRVYDAESRKYYYFVVDTDGRVLGVFKTLKEAEEFARTRV